MVTTEDREAREVQVVENQSRLRDMNERVGKEIADDDAHEFMCECAEVRCMQTIRLTKEAYERVRGVSNRFLVAPGHIRPEVERVVETNDHFTIVEKFGEGSYVAVRLDARHRELIAELTGVAGT